MLCKNEKLRSLQSDILKCPSKNHMYVYVSLLSHEVTWRKPSRHQYGCRHKVPFGSTAFEKSSALKFSTCSSREWSPLIKRSDRSYCPLSAPLPLVPEIVSLLCHWQFPAASLDINSPCLFLHYLSWTYSLPLSALSWLRENKQMFQIKVSQKCQRSSVSSSSSLCVGSVRLCDCVCVYVCARACYAYTQSSKVGHRLTWQLGIQSCGTQGLVVALHVNYSGISDVRNHRWWAVIASWRVQSRQTSLGGLIIHIL